ncbi:unnamed protein product [Ambrosiozyma monospora]|uniref:Unnamed protein product n=1 Tax=Ambrosiozyma monospora TaxID=43982 RepID=A0A9W6Z7E0_AMBMO|nr:unnamed protein product [Ambrosiozyma monospora]
MIFITCSGQYAAHWGGDNESVWSYLRFSISQSFSFGLFGIPFFGADVCGFNKNTTEEMCSRWTQLGSFFPFYRNHNTKTTIAQEPYVWDSVAETSKNSIELRYTLLPYYYTLLAHSHLFDGLPVMRASSWVFPYDESLFGLDSQFFIGDALLVVPALLSGVSNVSGTFPGLDKDEIYYNWYDKKVFNNTNVVQTLDAPLNGDVPLFVRGGFVLPLQDPGYTISKSRVNPFRLVAALDADGNASGDLFLDDGESPLDSNYEGNYRNVEFQVVDGGLLTVGASGNYKVGDDVVLESVTVLGVTKKPDNVVFTYAGDKTGNRITSFDYHNTTLVISGLGNYTDGAFNRNFTLSW